MKAKISKYMDIKRIEFIITWQCAGKCRHCQSGHDISKPGLHRHVLSDYAVEAVKKLASVYDVTSIMTFGGEPLHYPEVTAAIHKAAADSGIETRQIITNGYFTNNVERSRDVAKMLADAGVNNLLISVDAFHQEYIPIEPVCQFIHDAIDAKIPGVLLHPAWLINKDHQNPYNARTKEILEQISNLGIAVGYGNNVEIGGYGGQSINLLREYYSETELLLEDSNTEPCLCPLELTSISIEPNGDVTSCGFVHGNIYEEDIIDMLTRYDPYENEVIHTQLQGGVSGLLAYAEKQGVVIDKTKYHNWCNICSEATTHLMSQTRAN